MAPKFLSLNLNEKKKAEKAAAPAEKINMTPMDYIESQARIGVYLREARRTVSRGFNSIAVAATGVGMQFVSDFVEGKYPMFHPHLFNTAHDIGSALTVSGMALSLFFFLDVNYYKREVEKDIKLIANSQFADSIVEIHSFTPRIRIAVPNDFQNPKKVN